MTAAAAFEPDYAITPGQHLLTVLDTLHMTQSDLAARTGISSKHINQIIKKGVSVSPETATQLEYATSVPVEVWTGLDARYQALLARQRARARLSEQLAWLDRFNLGELAQRRVLPSSGRSVENVEILLRYFGISDPDGWERVWVPSMTSFRRSPSFKPDATATTLWLRAGQRAAARVHTGQFDHGRLIDVIPELRALTREEPAKALTRAQDLLASAGIALVFIAEFDGCRASGATWWSSPTRAVILLSNRGKRDDRVWFSLFHELGHLLRHAKRDTFIDQTGADEDEKPPWTDPAPTSGFIDDGSRDSILEREADDYASNTLIPREFLSVIAEVKTEDDVKRLAKRIRIGAGIVAGRYQYETGNYRAFNRLRQSVPNELFLATP